MPASPRPVPGSPPLLLAGSTGPERVPARPVPGEPHWFEPLHVRDERGARERIAAQVAVGADVVVAPAWLTHRRALLPVGETRRAREWTAAAVRVARQAIDAGLERRSSADQAGLGSGSSADETGLEREARPAISRAHPLLAASLPGLDEPETGTGRLLPREAARERDYVDQAGLLADAEPDLLLVEGQSTLAELQLAVACALDTGLPAWVALPAALSPTDAAAALEWLAAEPAEIALLPGAPPGGVARWGALTASAEIARQRLDEGAAVIGLLDDAGPQRLRPLREVLDQRQRAELEAALAGEQRWRRFLQRAAAMTPGGAAAWLGEPTGGAARPLPAGFAWSVVPWAGADLPAEHFRLLVIPPGARASSGSFGRSLEHGGVLVAALDDRLRASGALEGLRLLLVDDEADPPLALWRRED